MADVFAYLYGFGAGGDFTKSVIIVTAPTGSTVTCTKGTTVKTATEKNGEWWFKGLDIGTWTLKATLSGQTATQIVSITQFDVYRTAIVYRVTPEFTYTGDYGIVQDNDSTITDFSNWKGNWKIRFLTSGTFRITNRYGWNGKIDAFLVGAGGSGNSGYGSGGGSGYTKTVKGLTLTENTDYHIIIGAGGIGVSTLTGNTGGSTSAFSNTASGGTGGETRQGGRGGSGGGSVNGTGGSDGSNGANGAYTGGTGQGSTTREFGESGAKLYAGGGGGENAAGGDGGGAAGGFNSSGGNAAANTGGGGGGTNDPYTSGSGGSGIVVIRNAR